MTDRHVSEFEGNLLRIRLKDHKVVPTEFGDKKALLVDFDVLEGPDTGTGVTDTYVFYTRCVESLAPRVGSTVTGRFVRPEGRWFFEYVEEGSRVTEFNATHRIKGSGYELREDGDNGYFRDRHGNQLQLLPDSIEKITLPAPEDGSLWAILNYDFVYCAGRQEFLPLEQMGTRKPVPLHYYTEKKRRFTRSYPQKSRYTSGELFQDILNNLQSRNPAVTIEYDHGRISVEVSVGSPIRSWFGRGDTLEEAAEDLNLHMIE